jgi:hypothetical protein
MMVVSIIIILFTVTGIINEITTTRVITGGGIQIRAEPGGVSVSPPPPSQAPAPPRPNK